MSSFLSDQQEEEKRSEESKSNVGKLLKIKRKSFEKNLSDLRNKYDELSKKYDGVAASLNLWIDAQKMESNLQMDLNDINAEKFTKCSVYMIHLVDTMNKIAKHIEDLNTKGEIKKMIKLSNQIANELNAGGDPDTMFMKKNYLDIERRIRL